MDVNEIKKKNWSKSTTPLVSISCITFNHEKFLKETFEGFLTQRTNFQVEILIHDDASTDNSASIILEYSKKYPNLIFPILQKENQHSKGKKPGLYNYRRAKGKYIALCEGDDFWTDPYKLQKQVDFLEAHPDYTLCCGAYQSLEVNTGKLKSEIEKRFLKNSTGFSFTLNEMSVSWFTKTLTCVFPLDSYNNIQDELKKYTRSRDVHLFYHLVKEGKGYYFGDILGVYRIHRGGIKSLVGDQINKNGAYHRSKELFEKNGDFYTRLLYLRSVFSLLKFNSVNKKQKNESVSSWVLYFQLVKLMICPGMWWYFMKAYLNALYR